MSSHPMARFIGRRLLLMVALLLVLSFIVFTLLYLAPGSAEQALIGSRPSTPELVQALKERYNLDQSFLGQYWTWLSHAVQLDFGDSIRTGQSVIMGVQGRAGVTVFLGVYAFLVAVLVGVPLGVAAAVRERGPVDRGVVGLSVLGASSPVFVTGVVFLYVFAVKLGWFPTFGSGEGFVDRLWHMTLPAIALALAVVALIVKMTRTSMIRELGQDYVAFARARGCSAGRAVIRHALRNALVPIVTASGIVLTVVITGAVLIESVFALPGLGTLLVESVENQDLPMMQGIVMLIGALVIVISIVVDVVYALVDPRIRLGM